MDVYMNEYEQKDPVNEERVKMDVYVSSNEQKDPLSDRGAKMDVYDEFISERLIVTNDKDDIIDYYNMMKGFDEWYTTKYNNNELPDNIITLSLESKLVIELITYIKDDVFIKLFTYVGVCFRKDDI